MGQLNKFYPAVQIGKKNDSLSISSIEIVCKNIMDKYKMSKTNLSKILKYECFVCKMEMV